MAIPARDETTDVVGIEVRKSTDVNKSIENIGLRGGEKQQQYKFRGRK